MPSPPLPKARTGEKVVATAEGWRCAGAHVPPPQQDDLDWARASSCGSTGAGPPQPDDPDWTQANSGGSTTEGPCGSLGFAVAALPKPPDDHLDSATASGGGGAAGGLRRSGSVGAPRWSAAGCAARPPAGVSWRTASVDSGQACTPPKPSSATETTAPPNDPAPIEAEVSGASTLVHLASQVQPAFLERDVSPARPAGEFRRGQTWATSFTGFTGRRSRTQLSGFGESDFTQCQTANQILHEGVDVSKIRACSVWEVMRGSGGVLRQGSEGITSDTHERLSKPAESIDSFLSHSWQQPRWRKLAALMMVYNLSAAAVAALLGGVLGFVLQSSGALPLLSCGYCSDPEEVFQIGWACKVCGMASYFSVLFFWGEMRALCGRHASSPSVFFDKYCINQAFLQEKREGIKALGATILRSRRLVVLHSRSYFTRLWTVYEIACFMSVQSSDRLVLVPEFLPKAFGIFGPAALFVVYMLIGLANHPGVQDFVGADDVLMFAEVSSLAISTASVLLIALGCFIVMRLWHRELDFLRQTLKAFRIQDADCFNKADREVVYRLVAKLERSICQVCPDACDEEALESFNMRVQNLLAPAVQKTFGRVGARYRLLVICCLLGTLHRLDGVVAWTVMSARARTVALELIGALELGLLTGPLSIACVSIIARCGIHLRGNAERLAVVAGMSASILVVVLLQVPVQVLRSAAEMPDWEPGSNVALALLLGWMAVEAAAILTIFRPVDSDGLCVREHSHDCAQEAAADKTPHPAATAGEV